MILPINLDNESFIKKKIFISLKVSLKNFFHSFFFYIQQKRHNFPLKYFYLRTFTLILGRYIIEKEKLIVNIFFTL